MHVLDVVAVAAAGQRMCSHCHPAVCITDVCIDDARTVIGKVYTHNMCESECVCVCKCVPCGVGMDCTNHNHINAIKSNLTACADSARAALT